MIIGIVFILVGCGVQMRSYTQVRERVDQEPSGNAGYLMGTAPATDTTNVKKTRKVYVVEFSKEEQEEDLATASNAPKTSYESFTDYYGESQESEPSQERIILPKFEDVEEPVFEPSGPTEAIEYTVEKDDTLQKISKKFYDSYAKWPRIYEANKDKLPDPNRIKPGIVLTIPPLQ